MQDVEALGRLRERRVSKPQPFEVSRAEAQPDYVVT